MQGNTFKYIRFTHKHLLHNIVNLIFHQTKMEYKKLIIYGSFFLLIFSKSIIAQPKNTDRVLKTFFKNGLIAKEIYTGIDE